MKTLLVCIALFISVKLFGQCSCNTTSGWSIVTSTYPVNQTVNCGFEFITFAKDTVNFNTYFNCKPGIVCNPSYRAELKKNGVLLQVIDPFFFPYVNIFTSTGRYSLTLYPRCSGEFCSNICTLYFKVQ